MKSDIGYEMDSSTPLPANNSQTKSDTPDNVNKKQLRELLKGVIAHVDVRMDKKDFSDCVAAELSKLGAVVVDGFLPEVTHLVFFGGYRRTYKTALRRKIHIVAPHWISDSRTKMCKQEENKYIPDMPPPKEEVPFFRKRRYKPIVDQIIAGTYVPMDQRDANYVEQRLTKSAPRKLNTQARTPRTPAHTPKVGGTVRRTRKKIMTSDEQKVSDESSDDDGYIKSLFGGIDMCDGQSLSKVISDSIKAMKERCSDDRYNLWVDSPATVAKGDDDNDEDTYVPLFERCKAKLLAENKLKPPSFYRPTNALEVTPPPSEPQNRPSTPMSLESDDMSYVQEEADSKEEDKNVSNEILTNRKRRGDFDSSSSKKMKLSHTPESKVNPKDRRKSVKLSSKVDKNGSKVGGSGRIDDFFKADSVSINPAKAESTGKTSLNLSSSSSSLAPLKERRKSSRPIRRVSVAPHAEAEYETDLPSDNGSMEKVLDIHSLTVGTPSRNSRRASIAASIVDDDSFNRSLKKRIKGNSQPTRRSTRLSMRVQIPLDKFLIPINGSKVSNASDKNCSSSELSNSFEKPDNDENAMTKGLLKQNNETTEVVSGQTIATTNLHHWEQEFVSATLDNIGGVQLIETMENSDTVLVSGDNRRTLKIMIGISLGCWIVSLDWIVESAKRKFWVDYRDFEVTYFPAAVETRMERMSKNNTGGFSQNLFSDCGTIFVAEGCKPSKKEIEKLVTSCHGEIVQTLRKANICIGSFSKQVAKKVDIAWIFDSITNNRCLDTKLYMMK